MRGILQTVVRVWSSRPGSARKLGKKVVVIADKTSLHDGEVVATVARGDQLRVDRVGRTRYFVRSAGKQGWVDRRDVVSFDLAIDYFTASIERNPTAADYNARGMVHLERGELDLALRDFDDAIRLDSNLATAYNGRGVALKARGELDKAMADFDAAIRLVPRYENAFVNRGVVWIAKGQFEKAMADYDEAIRLNPRYEVPYHDRGLAWKAKGELGRAVADFSEAIRLDPKLAFAYHNRALAWHAKYDAARALADYDQAIVLDPNYTAAHANRGCLWHGKGDYGSALADYTHALRLDPKLCPAYNNRAWLRATCPLDKYRDAAKAIDDATTACELSVWKVCWTLGTLAAAYALAGEFDLAVHWQLKAIELAPESEKEYFRVRLRLYQEHKPYRDEPKSCPAESSVVSGTSGDRRAGNSAAAQRTDATAERQGDHRPRPNARDGFMMIDLGASPLGATSAAPGAEASHHRALAGWEISIPWWWPRFIERLFRKRRRPTTAPLVGAIATAHAPTGVRAVQPAPYRGRGLLKCASCGKKQLHGFSFCQRCGAPLEQHDDDFEESQALAGTAEQPSAFATDLDETLLALVDEGQTEEAIRLYQKTTGADWVHAERAIEKLRKQLTHAETGQREEKVGAPADCAKGLGCGGVAVLVFVVLAVAGFRLESVQRTRDWISRHNCDRLLYSDCLGRTDSRHVLDDDANDRDRIPDNLRRPPTTGVRMRHNRCQSQAGRPFRDAGRDR
jgi:tetratricopeptide (TPR) repeat protein